MPLTATASLARRIDRTEYRMMAGAADVARRRGGALAAVVPVGGVGATVVDAESPFNKVIGLGLGDAVEDAELEAVEDHLAKAAVPVRVELSTLADPDVAARLTARGYRLRGFENVLGLPLAGWSRGAIADGIEIASVDESTSALWTETVTTAFLTPDVFDGPPSDESYDRSALDRAYAIFSAVPGVHRTLARRAGEAAGGASLFLGDGIALLCGAGTVPAHRRRGVQSALLTTRLASARDAGCEVAVVTTSPGSRSQANVQRLGFELLYSRAILVLDRD